MAQENLEEIKERMYAELYSTEPRGITHRDIEGLRERIGIEVPLTEAYNQECTRDGMRKLVLGIGDGNLLYWHPEYGNATRWGEPIAHPCYIQSTGTSVKRELDFTEKGRGFGAMDNIQSLDGGMDLYWYRPLHLGDFIWSKKYLLDVAVGKSEFAGTSAVAKDRQFWANDRGELVAAGTRTTVYVGLEKTPGERTKYSHIKSKLRYRPEDIYPIDADMDKEEVRGADPRYWEDVNEGDELTPVVKGPLLYVDLFNFNIGHGQLITEAGGSHRWAYEHRKKHPGFWLINRFGAPDSRGSFNYQEDGPVTRLGLPIEYLYGDLVFSWLVHLCTNWMGDDAWLYHLDAQYHEPIFMYDTDWVKGKVVCKYRDAAGQYKVDVDIHCDDNRGRTPVTGHATIILPSKVGEVPLVPPVDTPAPFKPEEAEVPIGEKPGG
ncbi:MAG: MaoC family dehydratase N-terminal domain-containing protein [Chloroflexi bacterium]|nr:MaoC family dehydratase N-terminal domain-containing protein [Chloroflexota bacterium]